jgi:hypothetical protein
MGLILAWVLNDLITGVLVMGAGLVIDRWGHRNEDQNSIEST